jgi:hypothetical protein
MSCLTPITLKKARRKTSLDFLTDIVPCGRCPSCLQRRISTWVFRMLQEDKIATNSIFLTLTYDDESIPIKDGKQTLRREDVKKFIKRLRTTIDRKLEQNRVRYYIAGEYGDKTHRPHYHAIIWNVPEDINSQLGMSLIWKKGHVHVGEVKRESIAYTAKYCMKKLTQKKDKNDTRELEFSLMSKGLGKNFITEKKKEYYKEKLLPYLIIEDGQKQIMPRYYREKIYTEEEIRAINRKTIAHLEENPTFADEKQRHETIKHKFNERRRKNNAERKTL